jgi:hypothetical protein
LYRFLSACACAQSMVTVGEVTSPIALLTLTALEPGHLTTLLPLVAENTELAGNLASRPDLDASTANALAASNLPSVRARALRAATDPELIIVGLSRPGTLAAAASNPLAPPERLAAILENPDTPNPARLRAACNPATPLESRTRALDPATAAKITWAVTPHGARVVRAAELVLANPFLAGSVEHLSRDLQRAVCSHPDTDPDTLRAFHRHRNIWTSLKHHPAAAGIDLGTTSTAELLTLGSAAADLVALQRPDLDAATASTLLSRTPDAEPHVLGRALRRFGPALFMTRTTSPRLASTRTLTASYTEPLFAALADANPLELAAAAEIASILDTCTESWKIFLSLADGQSLTTSLELAHATTRI